MFVRVKSTPNSPRKSVQLVESFRENGKSRQRIVRHIGIAENDEQMIELRRLGERIKLDEIHKQQKSLPGMLRLSDEIIRQGMKNARDETGTRDPLRVNLRDLREQERRILGIHEIHGTLYHQLGFHQVLPKSRYRASHQALYHLTLARIADPRSKRASVRDLSDHYGVRIPLDRVYRMMDHLDDKRIARLKREVARQTRELFPEPLDLLFFDCTTLYFESTREDDLRQFGYSKDGKAGEVQVLLALMVTRQGLPVSYEVFPGSTWEGNSLSPVLEWMRRVQEETGSVAKQPVVVADAGLFVKDNLTRLEQRQCRYVVGARLKNLPAKLTRRILDTERYRSVGGSGQRVGVFRTPEGRRLVIRWCPKRARKDAHDRERQLKKLRKEVQRSDSPKQWLAKRRHGSLLRIEGKSRVVLDEDRIEQAARWDGLHGVITNVKGMGVMELFARYRELWQVEESFRISKHDLKVRPVFHWTERRIRAHLAIAFMAFTCVRQLSWRLGVQGSERLSPERVRRALMDRQCSVLTDLGTQKRYVLPSRPSSEAQSIYRMMGIPLSQVPWELKD